MHYDPARPVLRVRGLLESQLVASGQAGDAVASQSANSTEVAYASTFDSSF